MKIDRIYRMPDAKELLAFVEEGFAYSAGVEDPTKPNEQTDW